MERLFWYGKGVKTRTFSSIRRLREMMAFGDYIYRDAHYLACDLELDREKAASWVPRPLRLASSPTTGRATATLFTAWFPSTTFGSVYREAGVFLHVVHRSRPAVYSPWMLVDDDVALIVGRELLGYPKKLGEIEFAVEGDRVRAVARRRGAELVRMEGSLGERVEPPPPFLGRPHRNVRTTLGLAVPTLIAFTPKERTVEVRTATLDVKIGGSERDPLHQIGFGRCVGARLHRVDLAASLPPIPVGIPSPLGVLRQMLTKTW
jgi:acetoacetate decarboxylase